MRCVHKPSNLVYTPVLSLGVCSVTPRVYNSALFVFGLHITLGFDLFYSVLLSIVSPIPCAQELTIGVLRCVNSMSAEDHELVAVFAFILYSLTVANLWSLLTLGLLA